MRQLEFCQHDAVQPADHGANRKTAQNAERQAKVVVKNITAMEDKNNLMPYQGKKTPLVVSLGKYIGILDLGNFVITGFLPAFLKYLIEKREMNKLKRRLT